jgi:hypothetical protein
MHAEKKKCIAPQKIIKDPGLKEIRILPACNAAQAKDFYKGGYNGKINLQILFHYLYYSLLYSTVQIDKRFLYTPSPLIQKKFKTIKTLSYGN